MQRYILMLNTGLRTGELLGLLNSDIDLQNRVLHLERGVKEIWRRDGLKAEPGRDVKVGKLKSATSKRSVPLNDTAIAMIQDLRKETYFGEDTPLVPDEHGNYTRPVNFRKRYYRILVAAGIREKGSAFTPPHICIQLGEWNKAGGRYHKIANTPPGGRPAGPQHQPDHRIVLRQKGHLSFTWHHRWLQFVTTMRQDAQKPVRKFCSPKNRGKEAKRTRFSPKKAKPGAFWVLEGVAAVGGG